MRFHIIKKQKEKEGLDRQTTDTAVPYNTERDRRARQTDQTDTPIPYNKERDRRARQTDNRHSNSII